MWRKLISLNMVTHALDSADIIKTIGAKFATDCALDTEQFHREEANLDTYLRLAHDYYSGIDNSISMIIHELEENNINLSLLGIWIHDDTENFKEECIDMALNVRNEQRMIWEHDMSDYLTEIKEVKKQTISEIKVELNELLNDSQKGLIIYASVTVVLILASFVIGFIYARSVSKMTASIQNYAKKVGNFFFLSQDYQWQIQDFP